MAGEEVFTVEGQRGRLAGMSNGELLLVVERTIRNNFKGISGFRLKNSIVAGEFEFPFADEFNFNVEVASDDSDGTLYVVWESCPCWGKERTGCHRNIHLWALKPGETSLRPAPGTTDGFLHTPQEGFFDLTQQNYTFIQPSVLMAEKDLCVSLKKYRYDGRGSYGWDIFLTRFSNGVWSELKRVSPSFGPPDASYTILSENTDLIGFFPSCDHEPLVSLAQGTLEGKDFEDRVMDQNRMVKNQRIEVVRFRSGESLSSKGFPIVPIWKKTGYIIPTSLPDPAPEPPILKGMPGGLRLVWGDLHVHSAYSKCVSSNDGTPQEHLWLQRDILGCRVLCMSEHVDRINNSEMSHIYDMLEVEANDSCIPLYGTEWAEMPAHDTNFYTIDRDVFSRLRTILLTSHHLTPLFASIKAELPSGSVAVIRHSHGRNKDEFGVLGSRTTELYDPELEWAMEAMQTRGNMMLNVLNPEQGRLFPSDFLNAVAKIGLVAGSDHNRGLGPNHFCLTGFWVPDFTPQAVFQAIRNRKTLACSNGKIAMFATLNDKPMGESFLVSGSIQIKVWMACATTIRRACLIRDGAVLEWNKIDSSFATIELADTNVSPGHHWYVVTAEAESVPLRPPIIAHASPFFVEVS